LSAADSVRGVELRGKVAIVTGASRGVGAATAVALAAEGAAVACAARATDATPLPLPGTIDDTVRRITDAGGRAIAVPTNLAVDAEVDAMVATTVAELGPVDILVNNAAITFPGDLDLPMKRFDLIFDVDLRAPVIATQAVVPGMVERRTGAIVNVSSAAALNAYPGQMAYGIHRRRAAATRRRRQRLPDRRAGRVGGLPRRDAGVGPLGLGAAGGRGRGDRLDAAAAAVLHRPPGGDGEAARRARDHGEPGRATAHSGCGHGHRRARLSRLTRPSPRARRRDARPGGGTRQAWR
jgi:NADP-dependent 3-hydroxy acid dehydrogenase YdfG